MEGSKGGRKTSWAKCDGGLRLWGGLFLSGVAMCVFVVVTVLVCSGMQ